ncbi:MAG: AmmeMemoRadiSam system protein B, partial [Candidatus Binatia bacterium]
MARVVSAYATSHILFSAKGVEERARRVVAGMKELGRRAAEARPDLLLMIVSDHMFNIDLAIQPPFTVGVSDTYVPWGDMGIPVRPFPGHREFATSLVRHAAESGFDLATAEELVPDHGVTLPLLFLKPWGSVPVVPLYVNINMDPVPAPPRCRDLAAAIRDFIETKRPRAERVAVVGSGGLSHWLSVPKMGTVAEEFDREVLSTIAAGKAASLARLTAAEIEENAGNGGLEIMNWMMMAVAAGEPKGETVFYEPIPQWFT